MNRLCARQGCRNKAIPNFARGSCYNAKWVRENTAYCSTACKNAEWRRLNPRVLIRSSRLCPACYKRLVKKSANSR